MKKVADTHYRPFHLKKASKNRGWIGHTYMISDGQWERLKDKPYASKWAISSIGAGYNCVFRNIRRMTFAEIEDGLEYGLPEEAREEYYKAGWERA
jgi:hypothetical protein